MNKHLTDGQLRAALDAEATPEELAHLEHCAECRTRQASLHAQTERVATKLAFLAPSGASSNSPASAWTRFQKYRSQKEIPMFKKLFAFPVVRYGLTALIVLAVIVAIPGTRALASQLLDLFRVQQVTVVPVDFTGMEQLNNNGALASQFSSLISDSITMTKKPGNPQIVADAAQASQLVGFTVRVPQGTTPSSISVMGDTAFTMTVDRAKAQALLNEAGRSDLVLPDSIDGAKVSVEIPGGVSIGFGACPPPSSDGDPNMGAGSPGRRYADCLILAEIPSPTVNAPANVNVPQLAQIALEFTGMTADQAAAFTKTVDWTSTLVIPIPKNAATYEQITVDGVTGTLIQRPADDAPQFVLIWIKNGIIYAIAGLGSDSQKAIDLANSLP
jgi:hypothetical protein